MNQTQHRLLSHQFMVLLREPYGCKVVDAIQFLSNYQFGAKTKSGHYLY